MQLQVKYFTAVKSYEDIPPAELTITTKAVKKANNIRRCPAERINRG